MQNQEIKKVTEKTLKKHSITTSEQINNKKLLGKLIIEIV